MVWAQQERDLITQKLEALETAELQAVIDQLATTKDVVATGSQLHALLNLTELFRRCADLSKQAGIVSIEGVGEAVD